MELDGRPSPTPFSERAGVVPMRLMEAANLIVFRLSKGRVGGEIFGAPVVLLTTSGRRTGVRRTKPLLALEDGGSWIVAGSRGGSVRNPDWFENLAAFARGETAADGASLAAPELEAAGATRLTVTPSMLRGTERDEWWNALTAVYPRFEAYQQRVPHREIPVVRLTPAAT